MMEVSFFIHWRVIPSLKTEADLWFVVGTMFCYESLSLLLRRSRDGCEERSTKQRSVHGYAHSAIRLIKSNLNRRNRAQRMKQVR